MHLAQRNDSRRRRNLFTALAISLTAATFLFYPDEGEMPWMMWRDAPWLAALLIVLAAVCAFLSLRTRRA